MHGDLKIVNAFLDGGRRVSGNCFAHSAGRQRRFINAQKYTLLGHREKLTLSGPRALKTLLAANKRLNNLLKESLGTLWDYGREGLRGARLSVER